MSKSKLMNHKEICKNIINVFEEVVDLRNYHFYKNDNLFYKILEHVNKVKDKPYISLKNLSKEDISFFMQILLDTVSICAATGSKGEDLSNFKLNNSRLLGSLSERRSILLKTIDNQNIKDWLSCVLFQGWINNNETSNINVIDLKYDKRFKNKKKCDFKVDFDKRNFELIECKRIHKEKREASLSDMIYKICNIINDAIIQIKETEQILNIGSNCRTIFLDISSYNNNCLAIDQNLKVTGFNKKEVIKIKEQIFIQFKNGFLKSDIDRVIIIWNNIIFFDVFPIALVQRCFPIVFRKVIINSIDYLGWTIGVYPIKNDFVRLITVSSVARKLAWIKAMYFSTNDQLIKYGKEEIRKKYNC